MQLRSSLWLTVGAVTATAAVNPYAPQERRVGRRDDTQKRSSAASDCNADTFASLLPPGASVNLTQSVPENGTFTDPSSNGGSPRTVTGVPALCVVKFTIPSSDSSSFDFALLLPDAWNNRFMATGNSGFGGFIAWPDLASFSHYGFASMSTNTGHYSTPFDASWALNDPESQTDWGYRSMHSSVVLSKQIISAYYGCESEFNYYSGCSTGGRQGLKEVTMFPDDFDGVIAGAPAWWTTHLQLWSVQIGLAQLPGSGPQHIPTPLFKTIVNEIVRQCDPQDGVTDGIISDPYGCHFIPETLLCNGTAPANSTTCLTPPQLDTLYHLINDWVDVNQTFVFPHLALGADPTALAGVTNAPSPIGLTYVENFLLNTTDYDYHTFDYSLVQLADQLDPGNANASFEVDEFRAKGGKLLQYQGLADQLISTGSSVYYHSRVQQSLLSQGKSLDDWYRMFLIPGMQHCVNTTTGAPWNVAAANQQVEGATHSIPGYMDREHDVTLAIMDWVEKGIAPDELIATKWNNDNVADGVQIQRPICPYPQQAVYSGSGNTSQAENWSCRPLY